MARLALGGFRPNVPRGAKPCRIPRSSFVHVRGCGIVREVFAMNRDECIKIAGAAVIIIYHLLKKK